MSVACAMVRRNEVKSYRFVEFSDPASIVEKRMKTKQSQHEKQMGTRGSNEERASSERGKETGERAGWESVEE